MGWAFQQQYTIKITPTVMYTGLGVSALFLPPPWLPLNLGFWPLCPRPPASNREGYSDELHRAGFQNAQHRNHSSSSDTKDLCGTCHPLPSPCVIWPQGPSSLPGVNHRAKQSGQEEALHKSSTGSSWGRPGGQSAMGARDRHMQALSIPQCKQGG